MLQIYMENELLFAYVVFLLYLCRRILKRVRDELRVES